MYKYGYRLRPPSPGAQPKGHIGFWDFGCKRGEHWGYVYYDRELSPEEVCAYDLDLLEVV